MKPEKREAARRLRQQGWSVKEITRELGVAKSSVSLWVRDIELTPEQKRALHDRSGPRYRAQANGSKAVAAKYRELRCEYQAEGRAKALEMDPLHITGCMLYWAEGAKARNILQFGNSDPAMMQFFLRFLREALQIEENKIGLRINCYTGNGLDVKEIEHFWRELLGLPESALKKTIINRQPTSSQQKGRKLPYGMCIIDVCDTRAVQHIFGAIQAYSGIDNPVWLD
jgi:transposase-like protein